MKLQYLQQVIQKNKKDFIKQKKHSMSAFSVL